MTDLRQILQDLCKHLEFMLDMSDKDGIKHTVVFFSGQRINDYWLPDIHLGTTPSLSDDVIMSWYVEINVDGNVIFRKNAVPNEEEKLEDVKDRVLLWVLQDVFCWGVIASQRALVDIKKH